MTNSELSKNVTDQATITSASDSTNQEMAEIKTNLTYEDLVIKKIAGIALTEVSGILGLSGSLISDLTSRFRNDGDIIKGIETEVGSKQVAIDLYVICEYGKSIPTIFDQAEQAVVHQIQFMTELDVVEFNMHVNDIMTREVYNTKTKNNASKENKIEADN